jgi:two-component system NarL family sensor kinase
MHIDCGVLLEHSITIDFSFLIFLVVTVTIMTIVLSFGWIFIRYRNVLHKDKMDQARKDSIIQTNYFAEKVRSAIAKNLHDDISMPLNIIKFNLAKLQRNANDKELSKKLIVESMNLLDESVEHIRNISKNLSPPSFMRLGYAKGISELCKCINDSELANVQLIVNDGGLRLSHTQELEVYRITQEILNNIIKHSFSIEIDISITSNEKGINTVISYSGFGLDSKTADELSETDNGIGLKSIQNRAKAIGASVQYLLIACNQYQTTINIPINEKCN